MTKLRKLVIAVAAMLVAVTLLAMPADKRVELRGVVVDDATGKPVAARVYLQDPDGRWLFVESATSKADGGSALAYREEWVPMPGSVEKHTTISAHPFRIELSPGKYSLVIERGKEYRPLSTTLEIPENPSSDGASSPVLSRTFRLERWIDMSRRGWFSGETHVHRRVRELSNVMLAEDLNVAFPVTFWTVNAFERPGLAPSPLRRQGPSPFGLRVDHGNAMISVDSTHVIFPRNTEYEVFNVKGSRNTLGALFILNHQSVFEEGMPPVAEIAKRAHREGALLDLDKHSWPWSMMLVPVAKVDLFELSNNSVWRTEFGFRHTNSKIGEYMNVERDADGAMTEWGWLTFGFENYYALLNCGFRLQPTAGTASGVHPVPLGYSRVYVNTGDRFDARRWLSGLAKGRSFVTTGPMLFATLDGKLPGEVFHGKNEKSFRLALESHSETTIDRIEVLRNGRVIRTLRPDGDARARKSDLGASLFTASMTIPVSEPSWIAVRSIQLVGGGGGGGGGGDGDTGDGGGGNDRDGKRVRFAHTAPWHVEFEGREIRPRRVEVEYLMDRVKTEIERNEGMLPEPALAEFREALRVYERLLERARD